MQRHHVTVVRGQLVERPSHSVVALASGGGTLGVPIIGGIIRSRKALEVLEVQPLDEPPAVLAAQRSAAGLSQEDFDVMKIGETRRIVPAGGGEKP